MLDWEKPKVLGLSERATEVYNMGLSMAQQLMDYYHYPDWKKKQDKKGLYIGYFTEQKPDPNGNLEKVTTVRGESWIDTDPQDIHDAIREFDQVYQFDKYLDSHTIVEDHGHGLQIIELIWKKMFVISRRQTILHSCSHFYDNGVIILTAGSLEHPDRPVTNNYVRASLYGGGWILIPEETDMGVRTRVIYFNCVSFPFTFSQTLTAQSPTCSSQRLDTRQQQCHWS